MLMLCHRRDADKIASLPIPALAVMDVIAAPLDNEHLLLRHMPVFAGAAPRRNFLHIEPDSARRAVYFRMGEPFQPPLAAPFPRLLVVRDHVRDGVAENTLVVKQFQVAIVGILDGALPRSGLLARAKDALGLLIGPQHHVDVFPDAEDAFLDPVADQFSLLVMERLGSIGKFGIVA